MLVLMRRTGESITIGNDIKIMILTNHDGKIRIGIDAPRELPVHRLEVFQAIKRDEKRKGDETE